jgi:hypothetical protein
MIQARGADRPTHGSKKVVSRTDAVLLMIASATAAVATTVLTVSRIISSFSAPVTLTLPLATRQQTPSGLRLGAEAHYTTVEATIPALPSGEAALLAWAAALNQVGILAVLSLLFLLAFRLRGENLFTAGSVWIVGACGAVLAVAGTVGQLLDQAARSRLAEAIGANQRLADESIIFVGQFNIGPVMAGVGLILVAGAFQFGRRLQKDTEGLI